MDSGYFSQQINLYLPEFRPRRDWLTAVRLLTLLLGLCVLIALLSGVDYWRRYALQQDLSALQAQLADQTRVTERIESTLASRATDQSLLSEVEAREESLAQLNGTLTTLRSVSQGNLTGFSEHMKNLSSASFEGLWLSSIAISNGGNKAILEGHALESSMVPRFIDRLTAGWVKSDGWRFTRISGAVPEYIRADTTDAEAQNTAAAPAAISAPAAPAVQANAIPGYQFILETQ